LTLKGIMYFIQQIMKLLVVFLLFGFSVRAQECLPVFEGMGTAINQVQPHQGVAKASVQLGKGFWKELKANHSGDMPPRDQGDMGIYEELYDKTLELIEKGRPALVGGDHSQSFATISAMLKHYPDLKVLWVDAHADINTRETSPSNNIHGMPLAGLLNFMGKEPWNEEWMNTSLKHENIVYIGIRDVDPGEEKLIKKLGIKSYPMNLVREYGIERILSQIRRQWKGASIHMSFDIDSLDPSLAPATGTPVPDGLFLDDAVKIIEELKSLLVSFELVEFNPELAKTPEELKQTQESVETLLKSLFSSAK